MFKLLVVPDQANYSVSEIANVIRSELEGGSSRYRRDMLDADTRVECTFTLDPVKHQYFRSFYSYMNQGTDEFEIDLLLETSALRTYVARFEPGSFQLRRAIGGASYQTRVTLEVQRNVSGLNFSTTVANYVGDVVPGSYATGIRHLKMLPSQSSFEIGNDKTAIGTGNLKAPATRSRAVSKGSENRVKMQFDCNPTDYNYIRAFYNLVGYTGEGCFINLVQEDRSIRTHYARIVPGSFKLATVKGNLFTVRLEADSLPYDNQLDLVGLLQDWTLPAWTTPVYPGNMNLDTPWVDP